MFPFLIKTESIALPTYFAVITLASCLAVFWVTRRAPKMGLSRNIGLDLILLVMVSGFIGARLFHVFFEYPALYRDNPIQILRFWEGGFVFYGGFISSLLTGLWFVGWKKEDAGRWLDLSAPIASMTYAVGRVGCLLAGCCYGKFCSLPWAITFPLGVEAPAGMPLHPTQVYAFVWEFSVLGLLLWWEGGKAKGHSKLLVKSGDLFWLWLMLHSLGRIIMELFRADFRGREFSGLSISVIISAVLVVVGAAFYLKKKGVTKNS